MRMFGRSGFYIKNTDVIENLHKIDTIVFDKTGTLTLNRAMDLEWEGIKLTDKELAMIKSLASNSSHPMSVTCSSNIDEQETVTVENFREIPAMGITGICDGIKVNIGSKQFVTGKKDDNAGSTNVYVNIDNEVKGYFRIHNIYRHGLEKVISSLKRKYNLYLLSGDNEAEKEKLQPLFGKDSQLLFNQSPADKKEFVAGLRKEGKKVLMIGDGLNDAGALLHSDVGITVADDIYSFSPACDGIIESNQFWKLHDFIRFTSVSLSVVNISFVISFLYNAIGIYFAVQGTLSPLIAAILMPVSSISVVAFATFSISLFARFRLK